MAFLNPLVLLGLAAAAIPLIIHLFNFRRPKRVDFSSLAFLRELEKRTMRRVRIRQWLLLALRTLAIVCLVLAFARPTLVSAWEGVFGRRAPAAVALVLDNSLSMTQRDAQGAYLDQGKALAEALAEAAQPGDELFLVQTAPPPGRAPAAFASAEPALDAIEDVETAPGALTITDALARAGSLLEGAQNPVRELFLITDLQESTLADSVSSVLPEGMALTLLPLGERAHTNAAVTDVEVVSQIVEPGRPVALEATLVRYGDAVEGYAVSVFLDGQRVAQTTADLPERTPTAVRFSFTPPRRGWLRGEVRLAPDDAEWDDVRYFALHVPEAQRVLVVQGDGARADLVTLALGLAAERGALDVDRVDEGALTSAGIDDYDAVALVGPRDLSSGEVALLARYVSGGGGLLLFPGTEAPALNPLLTALGAGTLDSFLGRLGGPSLGGFGRTDLDHPLFEGIFDDASRPQIESPEVSYAARYTPGGDENTLIALAGGTPFLQEIRHGEGRALLYTVAPEPRWSDFPVRGLFVPLLYRSTVSVAASDAGSTSLTAGEGGTLRVEDVTGGAPLRLVAPEGEEWTPAQRTVPGGVVLEVGEAVAAPGLYDVMQGDILLRRVAVNLDPRESDLAVLSARAAQEQLEAATGAEVRVLDAAGGAGLAAAERLRTERAGVELWNVFLALALAFLVAEMLVAMRWRPEQADRQAVAA
ncbi:MAG: BatA and WFA domain-containing protein [Rubricoccaceae bacterium]|nr:BatA and WFA domain-containing protein [Rubricoccaceae bacterium]